MATRGFVMNEIVVATDGSAGARAAVTEGLELARLLGAHVTFVSVRSRLPLPGDRYDHQELAGQLSRARTAVDEATAEAEWLGVASDYELMEGFAAREILRSARNHEAGLIVVGSCGHGTNAGTLLGSVSQWLVQHSPIPVVPVRKREAAGSGARESAAAAA
jgi:nucleotide-binding universal stress UspA family protein